MRCHYEIFSSGWIYLRFSVISLHSRKKLMTTDSDIMSQLFICYLVLFLVKGLGTLKSGASTL